MGRLVANTEDGEITAEEMFYFVLLLLLAGNETTTNLLGAMFLVLSENPEQFELIRRHLDQRVLEQLLQPLPVPGAIAGQIHPQPGVVP
jgi:cytochrome P450